MKAARKHRHIIIVAVLFAILYCLISLVNHYNFRTYALDLGAYTNALWDYAHLKWNDGSVFLAVESNLLADHFDIYLILFSPFSYILGTYTLLILQIIFVVAGGLGVYRFFMLGERTRRYALAATLYFYMFFGLLSAISFDYHSNTVAASLLPWLFVLLRRKNLKVAAVLFLLLLLSKENVSLWIAFVCLGLMIEYRRDKQLRPWLMSGVGLGLAYFVLITFFVMPAFSSSNTYPHFHYSILGDDPREAVIFLLTHPLESVQAFITNHTSDPAGDYVKLEFIILLTASGLYVLLRKPAYLLMLVPLFFQKFFHDNISMWGFSDQYAIEFAPVMAIGIFSSIASMKVALLKKGMLILSLAGCLSASIRIMDNTVMFTDKSRIRIYKADHYTRDYDVKQVYSALRLIPADAIVSAQSPFVPHLALRDRIYQFPIIKDAEYIVLSNNELPYPLSQDEFDKKLHEISAAPDWIQLFGDEGFYLFKKAPNMY